MRANGTSMDSVRAIIEFPDQWAEQYVGYAWQQKGRPEFVEWESLPLSSIWAPILGSITYAVGASQA